MKASVMNTLVGLKYSKYNMYVDLDKETPERILTYLEEHAKVLEEKKSSPTLFLSDFCFDPHIAVTTNNIVRHNAVVFHNHDFFELNYVLHGTVAEYVNHTPLLLKEKDLLFMTPGVYHSCYPCAGAQAFNIIFRADWIKHFQSELREWRADHFINHMDLKEGWSVFHTADKSKPQQADQIPAYIERLLLCDNSIAMEALEKEALAKLMLLCLNDCKTSEIAVISGKNQRKSADASEILHYITQNFATATLSGTAAHFGYTPEHLHRIIKKQTGNGFSVFQLSVRMSKAAYLLSETQIPIHRIAAILGLSGSEYFSRMFKKYAGISPREYRKSRQNEIHNTLSKS